MGVNGYENRGVKGCREVADRLLMRDFPPNQVAELTEDALGNCDLLQIGRVSGRNNWPDFYGLLSGSSSRTGVRVRVSSSAPVSSI